MNGRRVSCQEISEEDAEWVKSRKRRNYKLSLVGAAVSLVSAATGGVLYRYGGQEALDTAKTLVDVGLGGLVLNSLITASNLATQVCEFEGKFYLTRPG